MVAVSVSTSGTVPPGTSETGHSDVWTREKLLGDGGLRLPLFSVLRPTFLSFARPVLLCRCLIYPRRCTLRLSG